MKVRTWDARTGACLHTLTGHRDMVMDFTLIETATQAVVVVSGADDNTAIVFKLD